MSDPMVPRVLIPFLAAGLGAVVAMVVLWRDRQSFASRVFVLGMLVVAAREVMEGLTAQAVSAPEIVRWQRWSLTAAAGLPGLWLLFSLTYARGHHSEFIRKWRWTLLGAFSLPLLLVSVWGNSLFVGGFLDQASRWVLPLSWAGYAQHILLLLSAVLIVTNLESTLRASTGTIRWQVKFMLLGVGTFWAVQIYGSSQAILFSSVSTSLSLVTSVALLVAVPLILVSLWRSRLIHVEVYFSQKLLYNSVTVLVVGIYLLVVGVLARVVSAHVAPESIPAAALLVLLALLALATVVLSGGIRQKLRRFVNRHLRRPEYDYREIWSTFTERTGSVLDARSVCSATAQFVSETLGVPSVTVWLLNETADGLTPGGSTALSEKECESLLASTSGGDQLMELMRDKDAPVDLGLPTAEGYSETHPIDMDAEFRRAAQIRYSVSLVGGVGGQELLGFMTLNDKVSKEPFSTEDFDLVKAIADQAAATILNLRLSERLMKAREHEAFQSLSAFFVHDLKNLASRLSLTLQNLPAHFDNPEFREDLLKGISQSVQKIEAMCSRLSPLSRELEVESTQADLNQLVSETVSGLDGSLRAHLEQDLEPLPMVLIDPEEIQKVLVNLVLNASEAVGKDGRIHVATRGRNGWVELSVTDNGRGMSSEFVSRDLFKPFHTTKKHGLGIGLFHSKKIVEAHHGRLEVETEEGRGTTFRVMLPQG